MFIKKHVIYHLRCSILALSDLFL